MSDPKRDESREYRNRPTLDKLEPYYSRHISAMTTENLWGKSDIAAELAVRDMRIAELERLYETEQRHSSALMARINEYTNPGSTLKRTPTLLEVIDDHD